MAELAIVGELPQAGMAVRAGNEGVEVDQVEVLAAADYAGRPLPVGGYLPLAIGMRARQLHHHPAWTAAGLAADLAAARDRLELMQAENLSVAAAFDLSYRDLTTGQQRLFRRLGLHPGPDIDAYAAAAVDETSVDQPRHHLEGLYNQHLITEPARGRYRLHDLLREHAHALADADPADSCAATERLLDYYLHTAGVASWHVADWPTSSGSRPPPDEPLAWAPEIATPQQAAAWLETERPNLHAAASYAAGASEPSMLAASRKRYERTSQNPNANLAASPKAKDISRIHLSHSQAAISQLTCAARHPSHHGR